MPEFIIANFESGADQFSVIGDSGGNEYRQAMIFTTSADRVCSSASMYTDSTTGSPTGDFTIRIETDSTGPSGTLAHANATGTVTPAANSWNKVDYTDFPLPAGTYWIVLSMPDQAASTWWEWARDNDGGVDSAESINGGAWSIRSGLYSCYFRIYGEAFSINVHDCTDLKEKIGG